jgi:protease I
MAKVAFLLADDFEDTEFKGPYDRILHAGNDITVIGLEKGQELHGKQGKETFVTEADADHANPADYDAVVIPGGFSPDKLRMNEHMVKMVQTMMRSGKPVAAICHAPSLLIEADVLRGRTITSWPSIRTDVINAGAEWIDEEVVVDGNLITSRNPHDVPAFATTVIEFLQGKRPSRATGSHHTRPNAATRESERLQAGAAHTAGRMANTAESSAADGNTMAPATGSSYREMVERGAHQTGEGRPSSS